MVKGKLEVREDKKYKRCKYAGNKYHYAVNKLNNIDRLFKIHPKVVYVQYYCNIFTSGIL